MKKFDILHNVEIFDITVEGKCVAKVDNLVVFVTGGVPGDIVNIEITSFKKKFAEAKIISIITPSAEHIKPQCKHFGVCGGCKWQHMTYKHQLTFKQKFVLDAFTRIAKLDITGLLPIIKNNKPYFYRNKLEFSFSAKRWLTHDEIKSNITFDNSKALGFHIPKMFDKILNIDECYLQEEPSNNIRNALNQFAQKHNLSYYLNNQSGLLRTLLIRTSSLNETLVLIQFYENIKSEIALVLEFLKTTFPQITSLQYVINPKGNDTLLNLDVITYSGRAYIVEQMEQLKFKVSAQSFYQTNSVQAYELYKIVRQMAQFKGNEVVYDLYTGIGTIASFVSKNVKRVVGIDYVPMAIEDAKDNAKMNTLENIQFYCGDMKDVLNNEFLNINGIPDVIITDPPRAGMHAQVINTILKLGAQKIIYVSCNPVTQARDLEMMVSNYKIIQIQPVDMFPQTAHVENVVLLEKL